MICWNCEEGISICLFCAFPIAFCMLLSQNFFVLRNMWVTMITFVLSWRLLFFLIHTIMEDLNFLQHSIEIHIHKKALSRSHSEFWEWRITRLSLKRVRKTPELYCTVVCWILTDIRREKQFSHFPRKRKWNLMKMEKYFLSYFFVNSTRKSSVLPIITQIRKKCTYHVKDKVKKQIYFPNWN